MGNGRTSARRRAALSIRRACQPATAHCSQRAQGHLLIRAFDLLGSAALGSLLLKILCACAYTHAHDASSMAEPGRFHGSVIKWCALCMSGAPVAGRGWCTHGERPRAASPAPRERIWCLLARRCRCNASPVARAPSCDHNIILDSSTIYQAPKPCQPPPDRSTRSCCAGLCAGAFTPHHFDMHTTAGITLRSDAARIVTPQPHMYRFREFVYRPARGLSGDYSRLPLTVPGMMRAAADPEQYCPSEGYVPSFVPTRPAFRYVLQYNAN